MIPRLLPLTAAALLLLAGCTHAPAEADRPAPAAATTVTPAPSATRSPSAPATFDGSVTLTFAADTWVIESPSGCMFIGQVPDGGHLHEIDQLVLTDADGTIVATGRGAEPVYTEDPVPTCSRTFELTDVPADGGFYSFSAGPYTSSEVIDSASLAAGYTQQLNG